MSHLKEGRRAWVTSEDDDEICVIDAVQMRLIKNVKVGKRPRSIIFRLMNQLSYAPGGNLMGRFRLSNTKSLTVTDTIRLASEQARPPMDTAMSADGQRLYVTTGRGRTVVAIDTTTHKEVQSVTVGQQPWGLALSPDGKRIYTANGPSGWHFRGGCHIVQADRRWQRSASGRGASLSFRRHASRRTPGNAPA